MVVRALAPSVDQPKFSEGRAMPEAELKRLAAESRREPGANWKRWEPYLAERQWRTVRRLLQGRQAVAALYARSVDMAAYRWREDCCWALPIVSAGFASHSRCGNGVDPILKSAYWALRGWRVITAKTSRKPTTVSIQLPRTLI